MSSSGALPYIPLAAVTAAALLVSEIVATIGRRKLGRSAQPSRSFAIPFTNINDMILVMILTRTLMDTRVAKTIMWDTNHIGTFLFNWALTTKTTTKTIAKRTIFYL